MQGYREPFIGWFAQKTRSTCAAIACCPWSGSAVRCLQCSRSFRGVFPPSEAYRSCLVFYEAKWQASRGVSAVSQVSCG